MVIRLIYIFSLLFIKQTYGQQGFEMNVFKQVCKEFADWNHKYKLGKEINSIRVFRNWDTGELFIDTLNVLTDTEVELLKGVNEKELIEIIGRDSLPIYPLNTNRGYFNILDTLNFFSDNYNVTIDGLKFKVVHDISDIKKGEKFISLRKFDLINNLLVVLFAVPNQKCHFVSMKFSIEEKNKLELVEGRYMHLALQIDDCR